MTLRVTWLATTWPREGTHTGGVGRYVERLAAEVRELVDLTVVGPFGARRMDGVGMVELPQARSRWANYYMLPLQARSIVAATGPDVVHAHGDDWALRGDVPVVRTFYGRSLSEARSSTGLRKANHYLLAATEAVSRRRAALRLAIAPESFEAFGCHALVPPLVGMTDPPARTPSPAPTVLFIGSHQGRKRGWLAEQAVADAVAELGRPVQLRVVGPRDDAASWRSDTVHLAGLDDRQVSAELAAAWVLLAPSEYEGFGIPTVEALRAHVPVISTPNPGSRYISTTNAALPLALAADGEIARTLAYRLSRGPAPSQDERVAADEVVCTLLEKASPSKLVGQYAYLAAPAELDGPGG